jgi:hypothetical protein
MALAAEQVVAVAAGRHHALAATAAGRVFSWGLGSRAIRGREGPAGVPMVVEGALGQERVVRVAAGEVGVVRGTPHTWTPAGCYPSFIASLRCVYNITACRRPAKQVRQARQRIQDCTANQQ